MRKGYVHHGREVTPPVDDKREFRSTGELTFCKRTCFVLTHEGFQYAQRICNNSEQLLLNADSSTQVVQDGDPKLKSERPSWDGERQELRFGDQLIKRFKWPAANQQTILAAFEEDGWPARIDDPLPPQPAQDSNYKRRSENVALGGRKT